MSGLSGPSMSEEAGVEFRYQPRYCTLLGKYVWAIRMRQADGTWRIVNCLDKDELCFNVDCAFTEPHGAWPYKEPHPAFRTNPL